MWLFIHIPKTAGTSYRRYLESRFQNRIAYDYGPHSELTHPLIRDPSLTPADQRAALEKTGIGMIYGHTSYPTWREAFAPAEVATILRHPVDRCISHYQHYLSHGGSGPDKLARRVRDEGLSLHEFARIARQRNFQAKRLGVQRESLDALWEFGSLLLSETLDTVMGEPVRFNTGTRSFAVSAADIATIVEVNRLDLLIYELVRQAGREGYRHWPVPTVTRRSPLRTLFQRS